MKRKFLAAAVLGVMVSVTPVGAYAASTETSPLPVNSESDAAVQSEKETETPTPTAEPTATPTAAPEATPAATPDPSETPVPTETTEAASTPSATPSEAATQSATSMPKVSDLKEGWNSIEKDGKKLFQYGVLNQDTNTVAAVVNDVMEIKGVYYAFDENGYMLTGEVEMTDDDGKTETYYFETEGEDPAKDGFGSMQQGICEGKVFLPELKKNQLVTIEDANKNKKEYYADENGYAVCSTTQKIENSVYLFGDDGVRVTTAGFQTVTDENNVTHTYYLNADNTVSLGNHTVYQQGDRKVGWLTIGSKWYLVDAETGELLSGWQKVAGSLYYLKAASFDANGALKDGSFEMETGNQKKGGWISIDGKWYSFRSWGGARVGWYEYGGRKYYLHEDAHMENTVLTENGKKYFFESWGGMCVNTVVKYDGDYYYAGADGVVSTKTGWVKVNGIWYWIGGNDGKMLKSTWLEYNGNSYYLKANAQMATNEWLDNTYYFRSWGAAYKNAWAKDAKTNTWYYFDGNGKKYTSGWLTYKGNQYYLKTDGTMYANEWLDGKYYFKSWGGMYKNEWAQINGTWYFFNSDGTKHGAGWLYYKSNWYMLDKDGKMLTGWVKHLNNWYYLKSWGGMAHSEWIYHSGNWYYLKSWGGMYHDEWLTLNGSQYYFRSWGGRYQNCTVTINGKQYRFDASGRKVTEGWEYIGKYRRYRKADGTLMDDVTSIFNPSSKYITVDRIKGRVTIYGYNSATGSYDTPIKSMYCSVGNPISNTAAGTYTTKWKMTKKKMTGEDYVCWAPYVTGIYGLVYFHGVASSTEDLNTVQGSEFDALGTPRSHGCVRLAAVDAKWIYDNAKIGTTVRIGDNLDLPVGAIKYRWTGAPYGKDPTL